MSEAVRLLRKKQMKAHRIYQKALFLHDWFVISYASDRRAIRSVIKYMPEVVPKGCHGHPELEQERISALKKEYSGEQ